MSDKEFVEAKINYVLCEIVNTLEGIVGKLDADKVAVTKTELKPILINLYFSTIQKDKELINLIVNNNNVKSNEKLKENMLTNYLKDINDISTVAYFYAYYNDNFEMLNYLFDHNILIRFDENEYSPSNLFLLNKEFCNLFTREEYLNLINSNFDMLREAYYYRGLSKDYAVILKINPMFRYFSSDYKDPDEDSFGFGYHSPHRSHPTHVICEDNINVFGHEFIANADENKQKILDRAAYHGTSSLMKRVLDRNPKFICIKEIITRQEFIDSVGIETIATLSEQQQKEYILAFNRKLINEYMQIKALNANFVLYHKEILDKRLIDLCGVDMMASFNQEQQEALYKAFMSVTESNFYNWERNYNNNFDVVMKPVIQESKKQLVKSQKKERPFFIRRY